MNYPTFSEHLRSRYGRNWCVAARASGRTARYDTVITPKRYEAERSQWAAHHPAWLLADSLPDGDEKRFIMKAVQSRLNVEG